jgi:hypothetical protein
VEWELEDVKRQIQEIDSRLSTLEEWHRNKDPECHRHYQELRDFTRRLNALLDTISLKADRGELVVQRNELLDRIQSAFDDQKDFIKMILTAQMIPIPPPPDTTSKIPVPLQVDLEKRKIRAPIIAAIIAGLFAVAFKYKEIVAYLKSFFP